MGVNSVKPGLTEGTPSVERCAGCRCCVSRGDAHPGSPPVTAALMTRIQFCSQFGSLMARNFEHLDPRGGGRRFCEIRGHRETKRIITAGTERIPSSFNTLLASIIHALPLTALTQHL
ncbi:hypothetical protein CEXT_704281 [Caerostris extrusa]|uniref:Uncharacterized protein n=1 Tax=Caerostris extrusa TaxID=172846 RepID=A0AAV4XCL4_CAEEX|nr:hypothetical protein CEXT_704281 [Caerostris extrusa]